MSSYSSRLQQAFTTLAEVGLSKSADSRFLSALLFYCFTSYFFTVKKFLIQGLSLSLQGQKFLDSLVQNLILMLLTCHMLRSKVIVASQNNSALKTSTGHLGSTPAQSGCLMSVLSVNPVSFIQNSQSCGGTGFVFLPVLEGQFCNTFNWACQERQTLLQSQKLRLLTS